VATDPFVAPRRVDRARQEQNLASGVFLPPARAWRADRPGDLTAGQPVGPFLGSPGPNVGYALTLAQRGRDRLTLAPHESAADAVAVVAELAMRRSVRFGRAPVMRDVDTARAILGYSGDASPELVARRAHAVEDAAHDYAKRRRVVDAVPVAALEAPMLTTDALADVRANLSAALGAVIS
jgi:hypothetical protein